MLKLIVPDINKPDEIAEVNKLAENLRNEISILIESNILMIGSKIVIRKPLPLSKDTPLRPMNLIGGTSVDSYVDSLDDATNISGVVLTDPDAYGLKLNKAALLANFINKIHNFRPDMEINFASYCNEIIQSARNLQVDVRLGIHRLILNNENKILKNAARDKFKGDLLDSKNNDVVTLPLRKGDKFDRALHNIKAAKNVDVVIDGVRNEKDLHNLISLKEKHDSIKGAYIVKELLSSDTLKTIK